MKLKRNEMISLILISEEKEFKYSQGEFEERRDELTQLPVTEISEIYREQLGAT